MLCLAGRTEQCEVDVEQTRELLFFTSSLQKSCTAEMTFLSAVRLKTDSSVIHSVSIHKRVATIQDNVLFLLTMNCSIKK